MSSGLLFDSIQMQGTEQNLSCSLISSTCCSLTSWFHKKFDYSFTLRPRIIGMLLFDQIRHGQHNLWFNVAASYHRHVALWHGESSFHIVFSPKVAASYHRHVALRLLFQMLPNFWCLLHPRIMGNMGRIRNWKFGIVGHNSRTSCKGNRDV